MDPRSLIGHTFDGKYLIESIAGTGGMGVVYRANQVDLDRVVAVKVLHEELLQDKEWKLRFEREAQALAKIQHQHIGAFYSFGIYENEIPYIVMEFVNGRSLRCVLAENGKFTWQRSILIARQLCDAISHIHADGILHRDLSSNNIILLSDSSTDFVKILDFGLSKMIVPAAKEVQKLTQTGALMGSIHYMSPELCSGHSSDFRSDIYSLACILYECLTGHVPHDADNPIGLMHKHLNEKVSPPSTDSQLLFPIGLDEVILKALAKDPEKRYQTVDEFSKELNLVAEQKGASTIAYSEFNEPVEIKSAGIVKNVLLASLAALLLGLLGACFLWFTAPGLDTVSKLFLTGKMDRENLNRIDQIMVRQEQIGAESSAAALRKKVYERMQCPKGSAEKFYLAHRYAMHCLKSGKDAEAASWAWQGVKLIAPISKELVKNATGTFGRSICDLCSICLKSKSIPAITPNQLFDTQIALTMILPPRESRDPAEALCRLAISLQERAGPSRDLVRSYVDFAKNVYAQREDWDAAFLMVRKALKLCSKVDVNDNDRLWVRLTYADLLRASGKRQEGIAELKACQKMFNNEIGMDLYRQYTNLALKLDYTSGLNKLLDEEMKYYRNNSDEDCLHWINVVINDCHNYPDIAMKLLLTAKANFSTREFTMGQASLMAGIVSVCIRDFHNLKDFQIMQNLIPDFIKEMEASSRPQCALPFIESLSYWYAVHDKRKKGFDLLKAALLKYGSAVDEPYYLSSLWSSLADSAHNLSLRKDEWEAIDKSLSFVDRAQKLALLQSWLDHGFSRTSLDKLKKLATELETMTNEASIHSQFALLRAQSVIAHADRDYKTEQIRLEKMMEIVEANSLIKEREEVLRRLIYNYFDNENWSKALSTAEQLSTLQNVKEYMPFVLVADMLMASHKFKEAQVWLEKAMKAQSNGTRFDAASRMLRCYSGLGGSDKARRLFLSELEYAKSNSLLDDEQFRNFIRNYLSLHWDESVNEKDIPLVHSLYEIAVKEKTGLKNRLFWAFHLGRLYELKHQVATAVKIQAAEIDKNQKISIEDLDNFRHYWVIHLGCIATLRNWTLFDQEVLQGDGMVDDLPGKALMLADAIDIATSNGSNSAMLPLWAASMDKYATRFEKSDPSIAARAHITLSNYARSRSEDEKFVLEREKAISLCSDPIRQSEIWREIAADQYRRHKLEAVKTEEKALALVQNRDPGRYRESLEHLSDYSRDLGDKESCKKYTQLLKNAYREDWSFAARITYFFLVARANIALGDLPEAEKYAKQLVKLQEENLKYEQNVDRIEYVASDYGLAGYRKESAEYYGIVNSMRRRIAELNKRQRKID